MLILPSVSTTVDSWSIYRPSTAPLIWCKLLPTSPTVLAFCRLWTIVLAAKVKRGKFLLKWGSPHSQHFNDSLGLSRNFFVPKLNGLPPPCVFWLLVWKYFLGKLFVALQKGVGWYPFFRWFIQSCCLSLQDLGNFDSCLYWS